eukprot:3178950-Alexandrium_andersonii.AAC.1
MEVQTQLGPIAIFERSDIHAAERTDAHAIKWCRLTGPLFSCPCRYLISKESLCDLLPDPQGTVSYTHLRAHETSAHL